MAFCPDWTGAFAEKLSRAMEGERVEVQSADHEGEEEKQNGFAEDQAQIQDKFEICPDWTKAFAENLSRRMKEEFSKSRESGELEAGLYELRDKAKHLEAKAENFE